MVERVVAGSGNLLSDPPTDLDVAVGGMVLLLARDAVGASAAGASRAGARGEAELGSDPWRPWEAVIGRAHHQSSPQSWAAPPARRPVHAYAALRLPRIFSRPVLPRDARRRDRRS
jgi:hypothetical protein